MVVTMIERPGPASSVTSGPDSGVIRVDGLCMSYGTHDVLRGLDFTVRPGEVLALLGPNGAGKSTTIEILEGFRLPSAGRVEVLGTDPARADETWRADIGVVLQSWRDHAAWRVRELLTHFGRYYERFAEARGRHPFDVDELLALARLGEQADQRVSTLSGGQRRRLDVAIGIVGRPKVLFLDEPTAGFDPQVRREFHELVHRLADDDGTTILLTTHDLGEAEKLADRILILAGGRIVADGSADQLAREVAGRTEVRWSRSGERFLHATEDATDFVRRLLNEPGEEVRDLEVRRTSLEETYMEIVRRHESPSVVTVTEEAAR
jgi:ABC-2 type transport system ATP-binding protein